MSAVHNSNLSSKRSESVFLSCKNEPFPTDKEHQYDMDWSTGLWSSKIRQELIRRSAIIGPVEKRVDL